MDDSVLYNCWRKSGLIHQSELLVEEEVDNSTNQLNIEEEKEYIVFNENVMWLLDTLLIDYDFNEETYIEDEDILRVQESLRIINSLIVKGDAELYVCYAEMEELLNSKLISRAKKRSMKFFLKKK